ncbi:MAG: molybdopterin-dependent oxidoreductase, partial [Proteobacteria bacterium]|nr:molybdopterin-dependent oxidoreductase [Pseudomonadota bacterium]
DKDRFSYEGLNSAERLTRPMIKQGGEWIEVEWAAALEYVANGLKQLGRSAGGDQIAALATPHSTFEELYLLQKLMRGLGSGNVDFRLRQSNFSGKQAGTPWLGMAVADINACDRFMVVGSFLRKDHPLLAQRIRQAVKRGGQVNVVHSADDDLLMPTANKAIVAPGELVSVLAQVLFAQQHPQAAQIAKLSEQIAGLCEAKFGYLGEAANSVGGYLAGAVPFGGSVQGMNAMQMLEKPRKAYLLLNVEPELDMHNPQLAMSAMKSADMVVCLSAYKHQGIDYADVLLPIAPFTETSGTFVNTEGRAQSFKGAVKPLGDARPAWKVLRVLGNLLDVAGFDYDTSEAVRDEGLNQECIQEKLNNQTLGLDIVADAGNSAGLQRVADVAIYSVDAIVRRAASLQKTSDAAVPCAMLHGSELQKLGLSSGDAVKVTQGSASVQLIAQQNDRLPLGAVRVAAGHAATAALGAMFGTITVERA